MMSPPPWARPPSRRGWAPSTRCRIPVGALYDTHHGMTNARRSCPTCWSSTAGDRGEDRRAARLSRHQGRLRRLHEVGRGAPQGDRHPAHARGIGIDGKRLDQVAAMAVKDPSPAATRSPSPRSSTRRSRRRRDRSAVAATDLQSPPPGSSRAGGNFAQHVLEISNPFNRAAIRIQNGAGAARKLPMTLPESSMLFGSSTRTGWLASRFMADRLVQMTLGLVVSSK